MNASTYEALSLISRGRRRDIGGVDGSPRLAPWTGHGCVACRPVDAGAGSRPSRASRGANPDPRNPSDRNAELVVVWSL
jgi:hypothetical protein